MELESSEWYSYPGSVDDSHIPIDLFGSKKHGRVTRGVLAFADASSNIVFKVNNHPHPHSSTHKLLLDASANPLFSIHRLPNGCWKCYKEKELIFSVHRTLKTLSRVELDVFFKGEKDGACDLKVRGSPFKRSCNIYKHNQLVAQSSLMYKLHQIFVSRDKFRLTIFPETFDHALIVALFVIFLNGRK
ncbi:putative tubby-like domain-containing protein [Lupinus albus]|uniref:Putative tubby-like domain-containing protein n=1 Tax=Lupinus albus TaxID=3870 RepID=A0A6A4PWZ7_LUPAL|nr:putative tubby-like domain-containing protein [Lupinus albus]